MFFYQIFLVNKRSLTITIFHIIIIFFLSYCSNPKGLEGEWSNPERGRGG